MDKPNLRPPLVAQRDDEIFDVVDAEDRVVAQATRRAVHAGGLWHRATHVVVFNSADQVFLQKRSLAKDSWPGRWDSSCSGHLDQGEDYATAAVRELREEIGLIVRAEELQILVKLTPSPVTGWEFVSVFALRSDAPLFLHPVELAGGRWFQRDEVTQAMAANADLFTSTLRLHWPQTVQWQRAL